MPDIFVSYCLNECLHLLLIIDKHVTSERNNYNHENTKTLW